MPSVPLRILLLVHGYPPDERGGTELYTRGLAVALAELGHRVHVLAANPSAGGGSQRRETIDGVDVERWHPPAPRVLMETDDADAEGVFGDALARTQPDVVHAVHLLLLSRTLPLVPRPAGVPFLVTVTDFWYLCPLLHLTDARPHRFHGRLWGASCFAHVEATSARQLVSLVRHGAPVSRLAQHLRRPSRMRQALAAADRVLAPSAFVRERYLEFGVDPAAIDVVPLGLEQAAPSLPRIARNGGVRIGYLGALVASKGVDLLIDAFRRVDRPDARLTIRGLEIDPAFAASIREATAGDPRIEVGPPFEDTELPAILARLDLVVVPTRVHETFSRVTREALRAGVPVLASRRGALPEIVRIGESGLLFEPTDIDDLTEKLHSLVTTGQLDELRRFPRVLTMREHALELVKRYRTLRAIRSGS